MRVYDQLFIGGRWTDPATDEILEVRSPHDQAVAGRCPAASPADVDRAVAAARDAFDNGPWPRLSPAERISVIERFNKLHAERADEIATLVTAENGIPLWFNCLLYTSVRKSQ